MALESSRDVEQLPGLDDLADAVLSLRTRDEARRFLRDLCTLPELEALTHRWQTAKLLEQHVSYVEIAERVPTSTATVTRVAQWLRNGTGGYRIALDRAQTKRKRK
jgi:TrpR-related protein YerC/YecD